MLLLSSGASAKSPRCVPGMVTSNFDVALGQGLCKSQLVCNASVPVPAGSEGQP